MQVTGTSISTVTPSAPVASCGSLSSGSVTVQWTAVPGATQYELTSGGVGNPNISTVNAPTTSKTFNDGGKFSVKAIFGSATWVSVSSNQLSYNALTPTCAANG
jgi:hypothetical protein